MTIPKNPFEYEQATKLTIEEVLKYFIEDYNYSRFVASKRNVFLVGERGTGKTMTFLYNSFPTQLKKSKDNCEEPNFSLISVYVPCNTPLTHRKEYELLQPLNAALASEHFLVVSIMKAVVDAVFEIPDIVSKKEEAALRNEIKYALNLSLMDKQSFKRSLSLALDKTCVSIQESLNRIDEDDIKKMFLSFDNGLKLFLVCLKQTERLRDSHFSFLIDDAQLLNPFQIKALNSWIAYRDNALFSFKVATTKVDAPPLTTSSGGNILEGHDFIRFELEQPYQNSASSFGKLARRIVQTRLNSIGINITPEEFFPENNEFKKDIADATQKAQIEARKKYPNGSPKQISDYVYKYARAIYFRDRSPRANICPYTGFDLITHLSTGVIRNLLNPCYHMFDFMISEVQSTQKDLTSSIDKIPPKIQHDVILRLSQDKWEWMKNQLANTIEGCSRDTEKHVFQFITVRLKVE